MNSFEVTSIISMFIGIVLLATVRIIARRHGGTSADGAIIGAFIFEVIAAFIALSGSTPLTNDIFIVSIVIVVWMVIAYIAFIIKANAMTLPELDSATHSCVPKKTIGKDTKYEKISRNGFTRLQAKFRCSPSDSNLTQGLLARTLRFWGYGWSGESQHIRHEITIQCLEGCKPFADLKDDTEAGGEALRVQIKHFVFYSGDSVNVVVNMYAAMGAPTVKLEVAGKSNYWIPTPGSLPAVPITVSGKVNVLFPKADQIMKKDMGLYQWRCLKEGTSATAIVPDNFGEQMSGQDEPSED